jgi:hypothetical protein
VKHHSSTPHRRSGPTDRPVRGGLPVRPGRATGRLAVLASVAAVAVAVTLALSGCGIRDTALPVDAGAAASRTACPPAPDATLSKLAADESIVPAPSPPPLPAVPVLPGGPEKTSRAELEKLRPTASASPAASAATSPGPSATASDGTLVCSHLPSTGAGAGTGTDTGAP